MRYLYHLVDERTLAGRRFAWVMLILGLGVIAVPAGLIASALTEAELDEPQASGDDGSPTAEERKED